MVTPAQPLHVDQLGIGALGAQLQGPVHIPLHPAVRAHPHNFRLRIGGGLLDVHVILHGERWLLDVRIVVHLEWGLLDVPAVLRLECGLWDGIRCLGWGA